jgi:O-antigen/teichoic acid export membrane protein
VGVAPSMSTADGGEEHLESAEVKSRAASGMLTLGARGVVIRAIGVLGTLVLAQQLAPEAFGYVSLGLTLMIAGRFLADAGLGAELIRRPVPPARAELRAVLGFQLAVTVALAGVVTAVGTAFGTAGGVVAIMTWSLVIDAVRTPASILAQRELRWTPLIIADITDTVVFNGVAIIAVLSGAGVWGVAAAAVLRSVVNTTLVLFITRVIVRPSLSIRRIRSLLAFGAAFQGVQALSLIRDQGVNLLIVGIGGAAALGVWSLAYRLLGTVWMVFQSVWRVTFPAMARLIGNGDDPTPLLQRTLASVAIASGLILAPLAASASWLIPAVFGPDWTGAAEALPPAALGMLIVGPVSTATVGYLFAIGDAKTALRSLTLDTLAWFAVVIVALPSLGVQAVGLGMLLGFLVETVVLVRATRRHTALPLGRGLYRPVTAAIVATVVGYGVGSSISPDGVAAALAAIAAIVSLTGFLLVACRAETVWLGRLLAQTARKLVPRPHRRGPSPSAAAS